MKKIVFFVVLFFTAKMCAMESTPFWEKTQFTADFNWQQKNAVFAALAAAEMLDEQYKNYPEQDPVGDAWIAMWGQMLQEERDVFSHYPELIFTLQSHARKYKKHSEKIINRIEESLDDLDEDDLDYYLSESFSVEVPEAMVESLCSDISKVIRAKRD